MFLVLVKNTNQQINTSTNQQLLLSLQKNWNNEKNSLFLGFDGSALCWLPL
jgi:hypothetical protein